MIVHFIVPLFLSLSLSLYLAPAIYFICIAACPITISGEMFHRTYLRNIEVFSRYKTLLLQTFVWNTWANTIGNFNWIPLEEGDLACFLPLIVSEN